MHYHLLFMNWMPENIVGPTTARVDLYGFADMQDAAPGCQMTRELGYGIIDTWDDLVVAIQEIEPTTLEGVNQRVIELATNFGDFRFAESRLSKTETVSGGIKDSKILKTQMIAASRPAGPTKDPAEPEATKRPLAS
ncbi:hypothetical protein Tco_1106071 [Tanacetum coccineum]